jgi:alanine racemase
MEKHPETNGLRTWIEIDRTAIAHNYKILRGLLSPGTRFMAVVKSNAYGHNFIDFSKEMEGLGADWIGVDSILEGLALRRAGIKLPVLVLGYTLPERLEDAANEGLSIAVSTFETLEAISKLENKSQKLSIHIKVDTGMHRQGFQQATQLVEVISKLKSLPKNIIVEGLFTHFAAAKNPAKKEKTLAQIKEFKVWQKAFADAGFSVISHAAASAGAMVYPESHFDLVRYGIAMYGVWPSSEIKGAEKGIDLKPVLSWKTIIGEVKDVSKGEGVGYDFTATLTRDSRLAICPIGYWHGLPRSVSNINDVLIHGKRARITGRVSMDMITVDVTDIPEVKVGSVVTIIGRDGEEEVRADKIADPERTSEYEIITRLNPLIKRVFI